MLSFHHQDNLLATLIKRRGDAVCGHMSAAGGTITSNQSGSKTIMDTPGDDSHTLRPEAPNLFPL